MGLSEEFCETSNNWKKNQKIAKWIAGVISKDVARGIHKGNFDDIPSRTFGEMLKKNSRKNDYRGNPQIITAGNYEKKIKICWRNSVNYFFESNCQRKCPVNPLKDYRRKLWKKSEKLSKELLEYEELVTAKSSFIKNLTEFLKIPNQPTNQPLPSEGGVVPSNLVLHYVESRKTVMFH